MTDKVKIRITGKNPTLFIKELIERKIDIYELNQTNKSICIIIKYSDYKKINLKKTIYRIEILKYYGLIRIKKIIKNHFLFLLLFIIGIITNYILGLFIWQVDIVNPNQKLVKIVRKDLKELKISPFHLKKTYQKREIIKKKILSKEKNLIEWLEIEEKGSKYIVKIEERKKNLKESKCPPRNIIAKKNALLMEIYTDSGEVIKKKNDYLTKGEVVISGFIHNKETVVSKKCAIGKIYGEVWYKTIVVIPKQKEIIKKTGAKSKGIYLKVLKNNYYFHKKYRTFQKSEYNIIEESFLPIKLSFINYYETNIKKKSYTNKEIDNLALKATTKKLKKQILKEHVISKKVLKKTLKNSKIRVEVFYKVKEDITAYEDISKIDIEEMNKKEE